MRRLMLLLAVIAALAVGCGTSNPPAAAPFTPSTPDTIVISNFMFMPMDLTVAPGTKITVRNDDGATHTLTGANKAFDTGDIKPGGTATITAPGKPGSYAYICDIHQFMQGTIVVR